MKLFYFIQTWEIEAADEDKAREELGHQLVDLTPDTPERISSGDYTSLEDAIGRGGYWEEGEE